MYLVIINGRRMLIKETEGQLMNPETVALLQQIYTQLRNGYCVPAEVVIT